MAENIPPLQYQKLDDKWYFVDWLRRIRNAILLRFSADVNVKEFGAKGDGTTDDTRAIQAALDFASNTTGGSKVYFPPGTYKITSTLSIDTAMMLCGDACAAILSCNFATGDVLYVDGSTMAGPNGFVMDGLQIQSSVTRTNNYLLNLYAVNWAHVLNCRFLSGYYGIGVTGAATNGLRIKNTIILYSVNTAILISGQTSTQGCIDGVIKDVLIGSASSGSQSSNGIYISSAGDLTLDHVSTIWAGNGLNVTAGNGQVVQSLNVSNSYFDSGTGYGVSIATSGTGEARLVNIHNSWAASNDLSGIVINAANNSEVNLFNCNVSNNGSEGLELANSRNVTVNGGTYAGNTSDGISVAANVSEFKIQGANIGASGAFSGNGGYGVNIASGTSNNYLIKDNYFDTNTSGAISDGGTGTAKIITENIGITERYTNSLGADVDLNNTANYFTGPTCAQGTVGTWFASGSVTLLSTGGATNMFAKLWDGTTVIDSAFATTSGADNAVVISLSGYLSAPAGNIRISCRDINGTNGKIKYNSTGESKDSTLSVIKIS